MRSLTPAHRHPLPDSIQTLLLKACLCENSEESSAAWDAWVAQNQYIKADLSKSSRLLPQFFDNLDFGSQRLLSLLYKKMSVTKRDDPLIKELRGYYRYVWVRNQLLNSQLDEVVNLFIVENIRHVVIKGLPTLEKYYNDRGSRPIADLDVAIHPSDWLKAISILKSHKWIFKFQSMDPSLMMKSMDHAFTLVKDSTELDLHLRFTWFPLSNDTEEKFWSSTEYYKPRHAMLKAEHQLICSFVHGFHGIEEAMRTIADSTHIIRNTKIDWSEVIKIAQSNNLLIPTRAFIEYLYREKFVEIHSEPVNQIVSLPINQIERKYFTAVVNPAPSNGFKEVRLKFLRASMTSPSTLKRFQLMLNTYKFQWRVSSMVGLVLASLWIAFDKLLFANRKMQIRRIPFHRHK